MPSPAIAPDIRHILQWIGMTFGLHLVWETAQISFYSLWASEHGPAIARALLHCTLGDLLLSAAIFLVVAALTGNRDWPLRAGWRSGLLATCLGLAYTAWSEWRNVYELRAWAYAETMPTIAGIGVLPLLQWCLVPALSWLALRRLSRP